jgi:hypothetical protein
MLPKTKHVFNDKTDDSLKPEDKDYITDFDI